MNQKQKGFTPIAIIGLIVLVLVIIGGSSYYLTNKQSPKQDTCSKEIKNCPDGSSVKRTGPNCEFAACPEEKIDATSGWKTYESKMLGIGFKYPSSMSSPEISQENRGKCIYKYISLQKGGIEVRQKTDSAFLCFDSMSPELIQKQFQILEKVSEIKNINEVLKKEIESDFILLRSMSLSFGSDLKLYIDSIYNNQIDAQGMRIIGYSGSDVSAANYYYQSVFLKNNKIISTRFPLFSDDILTWAETQMSKNLEQQITEALKDENSQIYKIVEEYDLIAKSIHFTF
jgi:hypothetical protein